MSSRIRSSFARNGWCAALAALLPLVLALPLTAQGWRETSLVGVTVLSRPAMGGVGFGLASRDAMRTRLAVTAIVGGEDGAGIAGRVEGMWHFLLDPYRRAGNAVYGGAGLALAFTNDGRVRPAVQLVIGAENAPATPRGTFVEIGVGRGVRLAAGYKWRKRNAPRR